MSQVKVVCSAAYWFVTNQPKSRPTSIDREIPQPPKCVHYVNTLVMLTWVTSSASVHSNLILAEFETFLGLKCTQYTRRADWIFPLEVKVKLDYQSPVMADNSSLNACSLRPRCGYPGLNSFMELYDRSSGETQSHSQGWQNIPV